MTYKEGHAKNIDSINPSLKRVKLTPAITPTEITPKVVQMPLNFKNTISQADKDALLNNISSSSRALLAKYTNFQLSSSSVRSQAKGEEVQTLPAGEDGDILTIEDQNQINGSWEDNSIQDPKYMTPKSKMKSLFSEEDDKTSAETGPSALSATDPKKPSKLKLMDQEETLKKKQPIRSRTPLEDDSPEKKTTNSLHNKKLFQDLLTDTKEKYQLKKSTLDEPKTQPLISDEYLFTIGGDVVDLTNLKYSPLSNPPKKPTNKKEGLISIKEYGLQDLFPFEYFNAVQSECFNLVWNSNDNIIVSAPTGSGKTVLFELAIARYVFHSKSNGFARFKVIYIAPIKALCQQKFNEWKKKFAVYNLNLLELTGDVDITDFSQYDSAHIIVTTPEKWDSITRRWKDNSRLVANISLLLIDEVHLLNTEGRGATLEALVARMKTISKSDEFGKGCCSNLRIIAISATIPNIKDLGEWLEVAPACIKNFGDEYRSTPIEKHVFGYVMPRNEFQFEKSLDFKLAEIIRKFSSGKPTLIFCQTQRGTINACEQLTIDMNSKELVKGEAQVKKLTEISRKLMDKNLQKFVPFGVAFHNAGMTYDDRRTIEDLFINGFIQVICTTTTLAMGVNLPARLVIIKSTLCYRGTGVGYTEYSPLEIDQMIGRAGRPQFDTQGVVVIMTEKHQVERYRKQVIEKDDLESHFSEQLAEHINAEISLRSIRNLETVVKYLKGTFFYIRMLKNPNNYGINDKTLCNAKMIDEYLTSMSKKVLKELHQYEMIQYNVQDGSVNPLDLGSDMSRFYISFATMKKMHENQDNQDIKNLLSTLSEAQEFEKLRSKLEERKTLSHLNTLIKFPLVGAVSTSSKKAYVLLQAGIGNISFEDWELKRQMNDMINTSLKILQCFKRFYLIKRAGKGFTNCLKLIKFLNMRTWEDNKTTILRQLPGIGDKLAASLCEAHFETFEKLDNAAPYMIESICNKNPPFGIQLQKRAKQIPRLNVNIFDVNPDGLKVSLVLLNKDKILPPERWDLRCGFQFIVQDKANRAQFIRYISIDDDLSRGITVSISGIKGLTYPLTILVINERYVGVDLKYMVHANGTSSSFSGEFSPPKEKDMAIEKEGPKQKEEISASNEDKKLNLYNMTMRCSHKCKDKKKCKHACCKIGTVSPPKRVIGNPGKTLLQPTLDVIDENIEYIDALLEEEDAKEQNSPVLDFSSNKNLEATEKKKEKQQTDIMNYMTIKKEKYEPSFEKMKTAKIESIKKQKIDQGALKESCKSLLEKYSIFGAEEDLPQNAKIEPQEQFHKLFGNIFN